MWAKGGEGGLELADEVLALTEQPSSFRLLYEDALPLREKIETDAANPTIIKTVRGLGYRAE